MIGIKINQSALSLRKTLKYSNNYSFIQDNFKDNIQLKHLRCIFPWNYSK